MIYAHSIPNQPEKFWQTLEHHLEGVSKAAARFVSSWAPGLAKLLGRIHDIGKGAGNFQAKLKGRPGRVDHTSASYLCLLEAWGKGELAMDGKSLAMLLAYPLLGHHGGMMDAGSECAPGTMGERLSEYSLKTVPELKTRLNTTVVTFYNYLFYNDISLLWLDVSFAIPTRPDSIPFNCC